MNTYDPTEYYLSNDLGCCAALVTAGFTLIDLDRSNPRRVGFVFALKDGIELAVDDYWNDRLVVSARAYFDNTKMLKNRIYGG